ncbi:hypothetical protein CAOG_06873 [Capsaspora owczarzaki ATCC 30864]|uniref:Uncharacterized protein n=1 Tax=Capsaspora owczarzaki (strain ATCC 30864) TaxID=595528 RepID=A0A0D2UNL9_CAPO3|nr:hypothetical protein CAOG_06873 [Capsaspora owczarzaki ATCC 30864]KJE96571.1 hypothetical protein CAOG_006873 [Capsaspora owczarzaki ATCC 30864]|eukprot:XP_004344494.2 hypothetical protein CAOG_06873 [Capsaspora owczarzaki ATCC 30864]
MSSTSSLHKLDGGNGSSASPLSSTPSSASMLPWSDQFNHNYITDRGVFALKEHKYNGRDSSILYNKVLRPLAIHLVERYVPTWVAPNVLTLVGLAFTIAGFIPIYSHCRAMYEPAPTWMYVWAAFCLFAYQTLDNMDGVQARRTGTSSPFGQLLDHGCDALNATIATATFAVVLQLGHMNAIRLICCTYAVFFMTTWDEYYTGEMHLAVVNGADEGITVVWMLYLATAVIGPEMWDGFWYEGANAGGHIVLYVTFAGAIIACLDALRRVYTRFRRQAQLPMPAHIQGGFSGALLTLFPAAFIIFMALWWICIPVANEYYAPKGNLYVPFGAVGLLFALTVCKLILSHMCRMPYPAFHRPLLLLFLPLINRHLGVRFTGEPYYEEGVAGVVTLLLALAAFGHYVYFATHQITSALQINVLTIPHDKPGSATTV